MILQTPFHPRTGAANETGLWSHWSGYLAADRYQLSDKAEYFAIRNSAGIIDTSPLYKYRISGAHAERYLAGLLTRDVRRCRPGQAQYTLWCDDQGWVLEDGVIFRHAPDEFLVTTARPNLAFFESWVERLAVEVEDVSEDYGALALQGPLAREVMGKLSPEVERLAFFHLVPAKIGGAAVTVSRTGYTGDLGYEIWVEAEDALELWDVLFEAAAPYGVVPVGQTALLIARIEAGLLLIDLDYQSGRFAWNDDQRMTPLELGLGWMLRGLEDDDRAFIGRAAIERELASGSSRWKTVGIVVDSGDWDRVYRERGLIPPKDHRPQHGGLMLYDEDLLRVGYVTSFVYSPILQRHIGIARLQPDWAAIGARVGLEITIDHRYAVIGSNVTRLPFFNPARKTA